MNITMWACSDEYYCASCGCAVMNITVHHVDVIRCGSHVDLTGVRTCDNKEACIHKHSSNPNESTCLCFFTFFASSMHIHRLAVKTQWR